MKVKYLDIESRFHYLSCNMMFNIYNGKAPSYLCTFDKVTDVHSHFTRNSNMCYVIPQVKTQGSRSFMFNAAKAWNDIPNCIKNVDSKDDFKMKCKSYLFKRMQDEENNEFVM